MKNFNTVSVQMWLLHSDNFITTVEMVLIFFFYKHYCNASCKKADSSFFDGTDKLLKCSS